MEPVTFERHFRTPHSEGYYLRNRSNDRVGRVDLHFATDVVYATLIVEIETTEDDLYDLIEQIDEDLVVTADVHRDDFLVTVYRGRDLGFYSDDYFGEEEEEEDEEEGEDKKEEDEGNGREEDTQRGNRR